MRNYLAMQVMERKGLGGPQGKVGMLWRSHCNDFMLTSYSHLSFVLSIFKYWFMETNWSEYDGSNHLLFTR